MGLGLLGLGLVCLVVGGSHLWALRDGTDQTDLHDSTRDVLTTTWRLNLLWSETEPGEVASVPFTGPIRLGVVSGEPSGNEWLAPAQLGMDVESAIEVARARLAEVSRELPTHVGPGVFRGTWGDGLAGARLALPSLVRKLTWSGPPLAVVATEDSLLLCEDTVESLTEALRLAEEDSSRTPPGIDRCPFPVFRFEAGAWKSWSLPATHPLKDRVDALTARAVSSSTPQRMSNR